MREKSPSIEVKLPASAGFVELLRCSDASFYKKLANSTPIRPKLSGLVSLVDNQINLPKIYAVLTTLSGPTGKLYDDWKGAYAFPFELRVHRRNQEYQYLLRLANFRSTVTSYLYRISLPEEIINPMEYHDPFPDELSESDIVYIGKFLSGYIKGFFETMPCWTTPFVMEVQSNLIIFGFNNATQTFFEEQHKTTDDYNLALQHWRNVIMG